MRKGTRKFFPTDYKDFVSSMIEAAENDELPVLMRLDDVNGYSFNDVKDLFEDFVSDTGLEIGGHFYICNECLQLHFALEINYPEENNIPLQ